MVTDKNISTSVDYSTEMDSPTTQDDNSSSIDVDPMSPAALAEAAYSAGVEHRKKRDHQGRIGKSEVESLREKQESDDFQSNKRSREFDRNSDLLNKESNGSTEEAILGADLNRSDQNDDLKSIVFRELDNFIQGGLVVFHEKDELERELAQVKELSENRGREVQRLKASEENSRASLSVSLLQASCTDSMVLYIASLQIIIID
jgi:hypothetical protein